MSVVSNSDSVSLLEVPYRLRGEPAPLPPEPSPPKDEETEITSFDSEEEDYADDTDSFDQTAYTSGSGLFDNPIPTDDIKQKLLQKAPSIIIEDESDELAKSFYLLASRPFSVASDVKNCLLRVYSSKKYDENLVVRAVTLVEPYRVLAEKRITIDNAHESINRHTEHKPSSYEDLQSLKTMLVTMFQEADTESNGYLTFDEFQGLMERIEVGITPQELRFVIAEADENENGFIDYAEFVPLAVDMIQAFRARTRAKRNQDLLESSVEDEVMHLVSNDEIARITRIFFEKVTQIDTRKSGALRPTELRRCLKSVAYCGLTNSEINMICQILPKDPFGRLTYRDFQKHLYKVKIAAMRNMVLELQGNDIHRYLMQICRDEERRLYAEERKLQFVPSKRDDPNDNDSLTGLLPLRNLINIMIMSPRLSLSRLQVMVIASEAEVVDGKVNYLRFAPMAAKTIEIMFEPKALRQRAELIETSDLSPEVLLNGTSEDVFQKRLLTLFKSYDIEKRGELNPRQFRACLESMDLQLSPGEILSLMALADDDNNGYINFEEFSGFCLTNLLHLEREKHIRILQRAIHGKLHHTDDSTSNAVEESLESHLTKVFELQDPEQTGFISYFDLEKIINSLNIKMTTFQRCVLISEIDNKEEQILYREIIPKIADILQAYKSRHDEVAEKEKREAWAENQVEHFSVCWAEDVRQCASRLMHKFKLIESTIQDPPSQRAAMVEIMRNTLYGLSRTEANLLYSNMFADVDSTHNLHSEQQLFNMIYNIRRTTIMRGLLENIHSSTLAKHLLHEFADVAEQLRKQTKEKEALFHLPVKRVIQVLENATHLRLHVNQMIMLISCSGCYQDMLGVDYKQFAYYAADEISKFYSIDALKNRQTILDNVDTKSALRGVTKDMIDSFLMKYFLNQELIGPVTEKHAIEAIKAIPRLNLMSGDAAAITAYFNDSDNNEAHGYDWKHFLPWAYPLVKTICLERMISRRMQLLSTQSEKPEDHANLQALAESLIDILHVRKVGGAVSIAFKSEIQASTRRSSLLTVLPRDTGSNASGVVNARTPRQLSRADDDRKTEPDVYSIICTGVKLHIRYDVKPRGKILPAFMYVFLRICENDHLLHPERPPLFMKATSIDAAHDLYAPLHIRLPSIGLVDQDAAEQFAQNLIDKVYIESVKGKLHLRVD